MELFEAEVWLGRMARLRNFETKNSLRGFRAVLFRMVPKQFQCQMDGARVLELCCFEWFQNPRPSRKAMLASFRAVLFRMVPKR